MPVYFKDDVSYDIPLVTSAILPNDHQDPAGTVSPPSWIRANPLMMPQPHSSGQERQNARIAYVLGTLIAANKVIKPHISRGGRVSRFTLTGV